MKKLLTFIAFFGGCLPAYAGFPPMQDRGSVDQSTTVAISVTTLPKLILSTGTNTLGAGRIFFDSTPIVLGQYLRDRVELEINNQSTHPVWIGFDSGVSTSPGVKLGIRIMESSGSWRMQGSIPNVWIVGEDTVPAQAVVIRQSR